MTGAIVGRAYHPRVGMCSVEDIDRPTLLRLIPDNSDERIVQPRALIQWRSTRKAAA
ncbi:MAG: hypothetical protein K0S37_781 [Microbacterium sp.]|jgi:hypothetical protein|nr:hypothetical protein [Microbacterium sp.]